MHKIAIKILIVFGLAAFLAACNLPQATPTPGSDAVFTAAAETVAAQLTQSNLQTPLPVLTTAAPEINTPIIPPTATLPPPTVTPSATPLCDLAQFVQDVTIPDGTEILPGQTFTKTWRLRNIGTCTWTTGYQLIFDNGVQMGGPATLNLAGNVAPGQQVDISVNLQAPGTPGTHRGYWRLRNAAGVILPITSGYQGVSFFVEIKVPAPTATPTATPTITSTPTPTNTPTP